jgi:hypothetical protein
MHHTSVIWEDENSTGHVSCVVVQFFVSCLYVVCTRMLEYVTKLEFKWLDTLILLLVDLYSMFIVFQMASEREGSGSGDSKPSGDEESKEKQEGKN